MTRRRPAYVPAPRILTEYQVACRFGRSEGWLRETRTRLEREGFPARDEWLDGTDAEAVELWFDRRAGLIDEPAVDDTMARLEAMANGQG